MDLLKRELAPVLPEAWAAIDEKASAVLKLHLAGRKLVDFAGPSGWELGAVNRGRLALGHSRLEHTVGVGIRLMQPLVELRVPIVLDIMELDDIGRGAEDPNLDAVVRAAEQIARVEDSAVFNGDSELGIVGIAAASPHPNLSLPSDPGGYPGVVVEASETLRGAGVEGPYALALGPGPYASLSRATEDGYPIRKRIAQQVIDGPIVWAPALQGGVVLSLRGGDFQLTVGQDMSIGFADRTRDRVELYITESFTFRVLDGTAAVVLQAAS